MWWLHFLLALVFYGLLDSLWFSFSIPSYRATIEKVQQRPFTFNYVGLVAYVLMALGMTFLVMSQATSRGHAAMLGAVYGLVLYGVFNFTNIAMFDDWTFATALFDTAWGVSVSSLVAFLIALFYI